MQVMDTSEHRAQHLVATVEVVHIGPREAAADGAVSVCHALAGVAGAGGIDRSAVCFMACVADLHIAEARE